MGRNHVIIVQGKTSLRLAPQKIYVNVLFVLRWSFALTLQQMQCWNEYLNADGMNVVISCG